FQLLPHPAAVKFLDENLQPLALDLFNPAAWKKYGWSPIFPDEFRSKFATAEEGKVSDHPSKNKLEVLEAYLAATLYRARRFQQALDANSQDESPVMLLAIGGDCEETLSAPIILRDQKRNRWLTLLHPIEYRTSGGMKISKRQMTDAMYAPGDGRVTRTSLLGQNLT